MDVSKLVNPYDFANPVAQSALFIGRESEMEQIRYYLDYCKGAPRPINLALLGPGLPARVASLIWLKSKRRLAA